MGGRHSRQSHDRPGVPILSGAPVVATDLRASAALVLAALAAKGKTTTDCITWIGATINWRRSYFLWELDYNAYQIQQQIRIVALASVILFQFIKGINLIVNCRYRRLNRLGIIKEKQDNLFRYTIVQW